MSRLIEFYREASPDAEGRQFSQILAWDDDLLEGVHDFIQWLFPLPEPSGFNPDAPLLSPADIAAFKNEPALQNNLRKAFDRILAFVGLARLVDRIAEAPNFESRRPEIWDHPNHNWLRITRILRSLTLLGLRNEAAMFFHWLSSDNTRRQYPISAETHRYWKAAVESAD